MIFANMRGGIPSPIIWRKAVSVKLSGTSNSGEREDTINNSLKVKTLASLHVPSAFCLPGIIYSDFSGASTDFFRGDL